ncbi:uncharacterized protein LOC142342153 [Convolutriloba macropyga]|uniref:uncharacterized protein LOC142342153 n=1 Tax=Convolutriloba macropyga TaxID=536237 RepID=UPI003F5284F8
MSLSGATVSEKTLQDFIDLKMNKIHDFMLIKFATKDFKELVTSHLEPRDTKISNVDQWDKMKGMLSENEAAFMVFPLSFKIKEGGERGKVILASWIPDNCKQKERMVFAASKVYLKNKLDGVAEDSFHATELSELDYCEVATTVSKGKADV